MVIDVALKVLKLVGGRKVRNWTEFQKWKVIIRIELTVTISYFNSKTMSFSSVLKFMLSRYQERDLIQPIAMKIFIKKKKKPETSQVMVVGKQLKSRCQVRINNIIDPSLDFENLEILSGAPAIYLYGSNIQCINKW